MVTVRVSASGQITIPASIRKQLGLKAGSRLEWVVREGELVLSPVRSIRDVYGALRVTDPALAGMDWETVRTETERIVAEEVAVEDQR